MKAISLWTLIICTVLVTGCNDSELEEREIVVNPVISDVFKEPEKLEEDSFIDLGTEEAIKEYLVGEWIFDQAHISQVNCKMIIDNDLNIKLSFLNTYTDEFKNDYDGKIILNRQYKETHEVPDIISIELSDDNWPGGDYFFLHRSIYDKKNVMSLFFAGNGNGIFDFLGDIDNFEYGPEEIIFEKASGVVSKLPVRKNEEFHAVFWGEGEEGFWLDDVLWTPIEEYDPDPKYPEGMINYENQSKESVLYKLEGKKKDSILLGQNFYPGEVYFVKTDEKGEIIKIEHGEHKVYIDIVDDPENYGYAAFENSDMWEKEIIKIMKEGDLIKESGPFTVKVKDAQILDLYLFDEFRENFQGKDKLTALTLTIEIEKESTAKDVIYTTGSIATNTGEIVVEEPMLSDYIGGEPGELYKESGTMVFILDSESRDIESIIYYMEGAYDENYNYMGEEIEFEIEF